jgi:hypothetical protein
MLDVIYFLLIIPAPLSLESAGIHFCPAFAQPASAGKLFTFYLCPLTRLRRASFLFFT